MIYMYIYIYKLNSTEMDFWRRSARISRKDKIRNIIESYVYGAVHHLYS